MCAVDCRVERTPPPAVAKTAGRFPLTVFRWSPRPILFFYPCGFRLYTPVHNGRLQFGPEGLGPEVPLADVPVLTLSDDLLLHVGCGGGCNSVRVAIRGSAATLQVLLRGCEPHHTAQDPKKEGVVGVGIISCRELCALSLTPAPLVPGTSLILTWSLTDFEYRTAKHCFNPAGVYVAVDGQEGQVVVVLKRHGEKVTLELPGGKRNVCETYAQTAQREVGEECGIVTTVRADNTTLAIGTASAKADISAAGVAWFSLPLGDAARSGRPECGSGGGT
jgi:hypothetical protein